MSFDQQKKSILSRKDKSIKQVIDKEIKPLVKKINSLENYYTSSSCAGRIVLIETTPTKRKYGANWIFIKHSQATFKEIKNSLNDISNKKIWLRQEAMIIHICCRNIKAAQDMLKISHCAGLKKAGIIAINKRIMIEAYGTDRMETIIAENKQILVDDNYIKILLREANNKLKRNKEKIKKFLLLLR